MEIKENILVVGNTLIECYRTFQERRYKFSSFRIEIINFID